jgi:transcriptional regulator with XRE-family HTH domain
MPKRSAPHARTLESRFGRLLRKVRLSRTLSQESLADASGYDRTYIGMLERGESSPSLRTIFDLAGVLKVKPSELMREIE